MASAVPWVITGFRPVSGQVPTFSATSLPLCASAPFTACAYTTPGRGPLLPQVMFTGVSLGSWASRLISVSCGNAQVSGATITASTPALRNWPATMSASFSPSISTGEKTTSTGSPSGVFTPLATNSATISTMFAARVLESLSMRGSHVAQTPNVTVLGWAVLAEGKRFKFGMILSSALAVKMFVTAR